MPSKHIRDIDLLAGYTTNDTVCVIDNEGVGQVNYPCSENRTIAVITEQKGIYHENVDGIIGLGRIPLSSGSAQSNNYTQFLAGLVNDTRKDGINTFQYLLDVKHMKVHLGDADPKSYINKTLNGFLMFDNQHENGKDDGSWALRIEDMYYGNK